MKSRAKANQQDSKNGGGAVFGRPPLYSMISLALALHMFQVLGSNRGTNPCQGALLRAKGLTKSLKGLINGLRVLIRPLKDINKAPTNKVLKSN